MNVVFFKPYGVVSQFTSSGGHKALRDFGLPKGIYPCGRLDHDSEGLLVLTDDGRLQSRLLEPRFNVPRTYAVQVEGKTTEEARARLSKGIALKDGPTKPCRVRLFGGEAPFPDRDPPIRFRKTVPTEWLEITLTEGKNRQVRRMTASVGYPTLRLIRLSHGPFSLGGLRPGEWRRVE